MPMSARRSPAAWSRSPGASSPSDRQAAPLRSGRLRPRLLLGGRLRSRSYGQAECLYPVPPLMCGIVGYVGDRPCRDLLIAGLEKLEYRGYDSAGVSVISDGEVDTVRAVGNLSNLRAAVEEHASEANGGGSVAVAAPPATIGLGHTRWATHGRVTEEN